MKKLAKLCLILSLLGTAVMPVFAQERVEMAAAATTATGYTKASDVKYVEGEYIANWGARDEACVFLSKYATSFYTGSYSYEQMSLNTGSTVLSSVPSSALHKALKAMVTNKQTYTTSYDATRDMFCYTDCVSSNYSKISSFYSGKLISGTWDSGKTWNREHTWPNSKGDANGKGETDIMMLRPTSVSENSSRGNTAYGEGSSYYDPNSEGQNVRGDCARIILYVYTRWGTANMWGTSGVMQSKDILLKWMEEDPVDTWEMGRNDAVQSITGTRNVYVDYPEYAWLLFGEKAPTDMVTPSGKASGGMATPNLPDTPVTPDEPDTPTTPTTPAEIVKAAYALASGESLDGSYTLTGKITEVDSYTNPTIVVEGMEDKPLYCFKLKDDRFEVGDTITVSGTIKNYNGTVEFDSPTLVALIKGEETPDTPVTPDQPDTPTAPTTQAEIVKAAYALASGATLSGTHTLTGEITNVKQYDSATTNICLTIEVEGKDFYCYWMRDNANGDNKNLAVGDTITVTGTIKNYNGTVEFDKPTLSTVVKDGAEMPDTPVIPDEPDTPVTPDEPDTPDVPVTPDTPNDPDRPELPEEDENTCAHEYGEWFIITPATQETEGEKERYCEHCGDKQSETIPCLTEEDVESGDGSDAMEDNSDKNSGALGGLNIGCQSTVGGSLAGIALAAVGAVLIKRKKENE